MDLDWRLKLLSFAENVPFMSLNDYINIYIVYRLKIQEENVIQCQNDNVIELQD